MSAIDGWILGLFALLGVIGLLFFRRQTREWREFAQRVGWTYRRSDPSLANCGYHGIRPGSKRFTNVISGQRNGIPITRVTYQNISRYNGALEALGIAELDADLPQVIVERPEPFGITAKRMGEANAVVVGPDPFSYAVWTTNVEAAADLLDDSMKDWMTSLEGHWGFEVRGSRAYVHSGKPQAKHAEEFIEVVGNFAVRIPQALLAKYPAR